MHRLIALGALVLFLPSQALAGSIFITGHDPIWHAGMGGNFVGAENLATTGIEFARNGSSLPFLFIESDDPIPAGNAYTEPFLISALGYTAADYVAMNAAELALLADFRTALNLYSAIVVASDHGGMLSADELRSALRDFDVVMPTLGDRFQADVFADVPDPRARLLVLAAAEGNSLNRCRRAREGMTTPRAHAYTARKQPATKRVFRAGR